MSVYLQLRGSTYHFRFVIPAPLRPFAGIAEVTASLHTSHHPTAKAIALCFAGEIHLLLAEARSMSNSEERARLEAELQELKFKYRMALLSKRRAQTMVSEAEEAAGIAQAVADKRLSRALGEIATLRETVVPTPAVHPPKETAPGATPEPAPSVLTLFKLRDRYLSEHETRVTAPVHKKHALTLELFSSFVGDAPITHLKRATIGEFRNAIQKLPSHCTGSRKHHFPGCSTLDEFIAANEAREQPLETIGEGTYKHHINVLSSFFSWASDQYGDQGFPETLKARSKKDVYTGKGTKSGEMAGRNLTSDELNAIFNHPAAEKLAHNAETVDRYWLLLVLLFTGARINELFQVNPGIDFLEEEGRLFIHINDSTEVESNVRQSVKTSNSIRHIPVHQKLINLGFIEYVDHCKKNGQNSLFPAWAKESGPADAGKEASRWVGDHFDDVGIYELKAVTTPKSKEAPKGVANGAHCFRHTLITAKSRTSEAAHPEWRFIAGHKGDGDHDNYGHGVREVRHRLINQVNYECEFQTPAKPVTALEHE